MKCTGYLALPLLLLTGCFFESYRPVRVFDLTCPEVENAKEIHLQEFRNNSSSGKRIQLRDTSGELFRDPYCQWALPPGELIPRAVNNALVHSEKNGRKVSGVISCFEVEKAGKVLVLAGDFSIGDGVHSFRIAEPVSALTAEAIVQAANRAVGKLAEQIVSAEQGR